MRERRATLCLVTDRHRLAAALHRDDADAEALLLDQITGAARGGVDLVQLRERDLEGGALAALTRRALLRLEGTGTRLVINDRVDVAIATGAHGVHLRESSLATGHARSLLGSAAVIGRSIHRAADVDAAGDADYLVAGSVFATESKPSAPLLGTAGLRDVVRAAGHRPVLAIGGVSLTCVAAVRECGAAGVAAIGVFIPRERDHDLVRQAAKLAEDLRFSFDTPAELP